MNNMPHCEYFTAEGDIVTNDLHDAGDGPLFFFWPLPNGDALRVPVCRKHCKVLEELAHPLMEVR